MASILVVDDESNIRRMLARLLEGEGHTVATAADADQALAAAERDAPDVILLDLALPGMNGLGVLEILRRREPSMPVVMMSGRATLADAVQATKLGAFHFIEKPLTPEAVLLTVESAVELRRARELSRELAAELSAGGPLVGSSRAIAELRAVITQIAPTDARVLITGESGTGKELVASGLHAASRRAAGPFVRVNSAALPRELVESELFGHEKGAFTGALAARRGRFELAHGGTLFLDEICDLALDAQAKVLRVIESNQLERVGGERPIRVDVRVLAATNRDIEKAIAAGTFREDLYYRLNVLRIHVPPLRDRREDIPELVAHFLARLRVRQGLLTPRVTRAALARMRDYDWPGNVRELANICERLAIMHPGGEVDAHQLDGLLGAPREPAAAPLHERLDDFERKLIEETLSAVAGNIADAARRLQTDRANLYRRMRRLGIER
jgi:two-component system nitrogen regulation response regulator NtrX